ncbi:hypothetical protein T01_4427 [Trichinella spiralis]|uniref:Uncharacterized protein n=1 Tax=Trichinella spiralis TaxID=6334 RepID=A0A0V0YS51_TRISP|nr:hypothetical protein T01_4427 [Trichinella spiralis]
MMGWEYRCNFRPFCMVRGWLLMILELEDKRATYLDSPEEPTRR